MEEKDEYFKLRHGYLKKSAGKLILVNDNKIEILKLEDLLRNFNLSSKEEFDYHVNKIIN